MYCPSCLNDSLFIKDNGVIEILINNKKMDAGRFLYNSRGNKEDLYTDAKKKLEEYIKWLSNFSNLDPIKKVQFVTTDVKCDEGCPSGLTKLNVVGHVIPTSVVKSLIVEMGEKYNMELVLES